MGLLFLESIFFVGGGKLCAFPFSSPFFSSKSREVDKERLIPFSRLILFVTVVNVVDWLSKLGGWKSMCVLVRNKPVIKISVHAQEDWFMLRKIVQTPDSVQRLFKRSKFLFWLSQPFIVDGGAVPFFKILSFKGTFVHVDQSKAAVFQLRMRLPVPFVGWKKGETLEGATLEGTSV